jgi:hypothetical protein
MLYPEAVIVKNGIASATLDIVVNKLEYDELMKFHATIESDQGALKITHLINAVYSGDRANLATSINLVAALLQSGGIMLAIPKDTLDIYAVLNNVFGDDTDFRSITLVLRPKLAYTPPVAVAD